MADLENLLAFLLSWDYCKREHYLDIAFECHLMQGLPEIGISIMSELRL